MKRPEQITGVLTALVTPFRGDEIDETAFADFVEWQIAEGADGLVPCSLTGEGPTLTPAEHVRLFRIAVEAAAGRAPVLAAVGENCTASAIELAREAKRAGADAALVVTPYYNRPNQEGLFAHFEQVARSVDLPIVLHVIPSHAAVDLGPATLERLAAIPSIVGLCDEDEKAVRQLSLRDMHGLAEFHALDPSASSMALSGAQAWISKVANVAPGVCSALHAACRARDFPSALHLQRELAALCSALESEGAPAAVKYAVSLQRPGFDPRPRLPIAPVADATAALVEAAMDGFDRDSREAELAQLMASS